MVLDVDLDRLEAEVEAERPVYADPELQEAYDRGYERGSEDGFSVGFAAAFDEDD